MAHDVPLMAVGLSHHTAPVEVRELLALDDDGVCSALAHLRNDNAVEEALLLSTCNRVELYAVPKSEEQIQNFFRSYRAASGASVLDHLYWHRGRDAVKHLFRVASSLDSLVVGEPQILGQVKHAMRLAEGSSAMGRLLTPLARRTLTVAKRVRTETEIGQSRVGIGNAGVDLALQIFGGLRGKRAMLVGVGEMGRQVARALLNAGLEELVVTNRTFERSVALAEEHGFTPVPYERMEDYLEHADIVIAATGAKKPIITGNMVQGALKKRRYRTIFLIDLAVPRNIGSEVGDLEDAYLFNVDDLSQVVDEGKRQREMAAEAATLVVEEETNRFISSLGQIAINDDLKELASIADGLRLAELGRSNKLTRDLDERQLQALDKMTAALVKKLMHGPILAARMAAKDGDLDTVQTIVKLWKKP